LKIGEACLFSLLNTSLQVLEVNGAGVPVLLEIKSEHCDDANCRELAPP
jgi:hypothetical protein